MLNKSKLQIKSVDSAMIVDSGFARDCKTMSIPEIIVSHLRGGAGESSWFRTSKEEHVTGLGVGCAFLLVSCLLLVGPWSWVLGSCCLVLVLGSCS